jgi:hypothetical protein
MQRPSLGGRYPTLGTNFAGVNTVSAATVPLVGDRYGMVLVPHHTPAPHPYIQSADDIVAQRQRDGWQLVSSRVDQYGAEVIIFRRPA